MFHHVANKFVLMSLIHVYIIGIKHDFPFINIRKVSREVLKTSGFVLGFQYLPRDLNVCALYSSALPPFSYARTLFINILDSGRGQVLYPVMI